MNWRDFLLRMRAIFSLRRSEAELEEELRMHLDLQARKHREAGASPELSKRLARREFGSLENTKEQCRDERRVNWFGHFKRDLQYAIRMFRRDPAFSAAAVGMLALGIGATLATFSIMDAILLKMLPVKEPASLFRTVGVNAPADDPSGGGASYKVFEEIREQTRPLADVMAYQAADEEAVSLNGASAEQLTCQTISGNYFQVLGLQPAFGRLITPDDDQAPGQHPVAVISDRLWHGKFAGGSRAIGSKIRVGDQTFQVIGVAPARFFGVEVGKVVDLWTPISMAPPEYLRNDHFFWLHTMGRLHPGVSIAQAAAPMQAVMNEVMLEDVRQHAPPGTPKSVINRFLAGMKVKGVPAGGGIAYLRHRYRQPLQLVMALAAMVLLIACTNVANLILAKGRARRREIAIRLSLGAGRRRILQQLMTESILLGLISMVLGTLIAHWAAPVFVHMLTASNEPAKLAIGLDARLLAFTGLIGVVTVIVSGLLPALQLAKADAVEWLKSGKGLAGCKSEVQRRLLVAAQIALSLVLVIGAILFSRTLTNLLSSQLGFEPANDHPGGEQSGPRII
jgi:predicted permease